MNKTKATITLAIVLATIAMLTGCGQQPQAPGATTTYSYGSLNRAIDNANHYMVANTYSWSQAYRPSYGGY